MKSRLLTSLLIASVWPLLWLAQAEAAVTTSAPVVTASAAATYTLDPNHSYVLWRINHFGFSHPSGKWMANGTLVFDKNHPGKSAVTATVNIADGVTGIPALDKHMQTDTFFDVAKFPNATFVSNKVTVTGKHTANVSGQLTVHGVSKPLTFHVTLNKIGVSPITNKPTIGFSGTASLNRSDYGISAYAPGLGDKVMLEIEVEASQA